MGAWPLIWKSLTNRNLPGKGRGFLKPLCAGDNLARGGGLACSLVSMEHDMPDHGALVAKPAGEPEAAAAHASEGEPAGDVTVAAQLTPALPPALKAAWQTSITVQWEAVLLHGDMADQDPALLQLQCLLFYYVELQEV